MEWCIVLVEMLLTRFKECWPLLTESLPELPYNLNIVTLTLTLWSISSGVLSFLFLPHLSSSLTHSLPSLNLLCYSKTHARFMQDGWKAVWSISYLSVIFFSSLKHNFIAYRSSKVSDWIFELHQLWQSGFSRVYSNCWCSCSFKPEIMKIGQSSHKMYSNNTVNLQESTTVENIHTKKSLETYCMHLVIAPQEPKFAFDTLAPTPQKLPCSRAGWTRRENKETACVFPGFAFESFSSLLNLFVACAVSTPMPDRFFLKNHNVAGSDTSTSRQDWTGRDEKSPRSVQLF